jgi:hypothetical protein
MLNNFTLRDLRAEVRGGALRTRRNHKRKRGNKKTISRDADLGERGKELSGPGMGLRICQTGLYFSRLCRGLPFCGG